MKLIELLKVVGNIDGILIYKKQTSICARNSNRSYEMVLINHNDIWSYVDYEVEAVDFKRKRIILNFDF